MEKVNFLVKADNWNGETIQWIEDEDGSRWFLASNIWRWMGYKDHTGLLKLIARNTGDFKGLTKCDDASHLGISTPGIQNITLIHEEGVYTALMMARNLDKAREFRERMRSHVVDVRKGKAIVIQNTGDGLAVAKQLCTAVMNIIEEHQNTRERLQRLEDGQKLLSGKVEEELPITNEQEHKIHPVRDMKGRGCLQGLHISNGINKLKEQLIELRETNGIPKKESYRWFYRTVGDSM